MADKLQKFFICFLLLTPFVMWQGVYEGPKVAYFFAGSLLIFIFWIIRIFINKKNFEFNKADYFYLLWLLILIISSLIGIHPLDSIIGGSYRHQGVLFFLALWVLVKTVKLLSERNTKILEKGLGITILVESAIVVGQFSSGNLYLGKPLGTIGEVNAVAGFLAIGSYYVFKFFPKVVLTIPMVAIFITGSRSGLVALIPNLGFVINSVGKKIKALVMAVGLGLVVLILFYLTSFKGASFFENRPIIWSLGITQILQKPVLGFGAESGEAVYKLAFIKNNTPLFGLIIDRAHNLILDILMWSGALGLIAFAGWFFVSFKYLKTIEKKLALLSFLIYAMFQPLSIVHWILLIMLVTI